jgi:hypothetical protein
MFDRKQELAPTGRQLIATGRSLLQENMAHGLSPLAYGLFEKMRTISRSKEWVDDKDLLRTAEYACNFIFM